MCGRSLSFLSQAGDIAQKEIEEAKERMAKFAPGGPGTEQVLPKTSKTPSFENFCSPAINQSH